MKYLVVSDIHGCLPRLEQVLSFFEKNAYDQILLLGDVLNYGPRNGVPDGLDAMGIVGILNAMAGKITAIRGNCDSEVDQMLLNFPCLADYAMVVDGERKIFLTHGHLFTPDTLPSDGWNVFFSGHTHLYGLDRREDGRIICNTGSITFPKEGREPSFATIDEDGKIRLRRLDGSVIKEV